MAAKQTPFTFAGARIRRRFVTLTSLCRLPLCAKVYRETLHALLRLYEKMGAAFELAQVADRILATEPDDLDALSGKARAKLAERSFDEEVLRFGQAADQEGDSFAFVASDRGIDHAVDPVLAILTNSEALHLRLFVGGQMLSNLCFVEHFVAGIHGLAAHQGQ